MTWRGGGMAISGPPERDATLWRCWNCRRTQYAVRAPECGQYGCGRIKMEPTED